MLNNPVNNENEDQGSEISYDCGEDRDEDITLTAECSSVIQQEITEDTATTATSTSSPKLFVPSIDGDAYQAAIFSEFFHCKEMSSDRIKRTILGA